MGAESGVEPKSQAYETRVLPLHHSAYCALYKDYRARWIYRKKMLMDNKINELFITVETLENYLRALEKRVAALEEINNGK